MLSIFGRPPAPSAEVAAHPIYQYLTVSAPGHALLISGEWGTGKSHFIRHQLPKLLKHRMRAVHISVAGLSSSDELERTLLLASLIKAPRFMKESGAVIGKTLLKLSSIDPGDVRFSAPLIPDSVVVCVDDVERFAGEAKVLFGFLINIVDRDNVHCILVADDERAAAELPNYRFYREKIVGQVYRFEPQLERVFKNEVNGIASHAVREALLADADRMVARMEHAGLSNLRTVKKLVFELRRILLQVPQQFTPLRPQRLFDALLFLTIATAKDSQNAKLVAELFTTPDIPMRTAVAAMNRQRVGNGGVAAPDHAIELIGQLRFSEDAYTWPRSEAFARYAMHLSFDWTDLARDFGLTGLPPPPLTDLVSRAFDYRRLNDVEFQAVVEQLWQSLEDANASHTMQGVADYARCLCWLSERQMTVEAPEQIVARLVAIVEKIRGDQVVSGDYNFWDWRPPSEMAESLRLLGERHAIAMKESASRAGLQWLLTGEGEPPGETDVLVLVGARLDDLADILFKDDRMAVDRFDRYFRARLSISNAAAFVAADGPPALQLGELIQARIGSQRPLPVRLAALRDLSQRLIGFAAHVSD